MSEAMCDAKGKLQHLVKLAEQCDCKSDKDRILKEYMSQDCEGVEWEEVYTDLLDTTNGLIEFNQRQAFLQRIHEFITNDGDIIDNQNAIKEILSEKQQCMSHQYCGADIDSGHTTSVYLFFVCLFLHVCVCFIYVCFLLLFCAKSHIIISHLQKCMWCV